MAQTEPETRRPLAKRTVVAFGIDVATAAGWWWIIVSITYAQDHLGLAAMYWPVVSIPVAFIATIVGIALTIVAGRSGGLNRAAGVIGGLLLLSPLCFSILFEAFNG